MSYDPIPSAVEFKLRGDISASYGQLGLTTQTVDTAIDPINQLPGTQYSNFYSHYLVNISAGNSADFILAPIGANPGVAVGYTACIDCLSTGSASLADQLVIKTSLGNTISALNSGSKLFLTAVSAPATWKLAYAVPEGSDNKLLVYNTTYPQVDLLPIQKEISVNGSNEYGIKSIQSYDANDPSNLPVGPITVTNTNKIVVMGSIGIDCPSLNGLSGLFSTGSIISCRQIEFSTDTAADFVVAAIACYSALPNTGFINLQTLSRGLFMGGCQECSIIQTALSGSIVTNSGILWSENCIIDGSGNGAVLRRLGISSSTSCNILGTTSNSSIIGCNLTNISDTEYGTVIGCSDVTVDGASSSISGVYSSSLMTSTNNRKSALISSYQSTVDSASQVVLIASDAVTLTGDGVYTYGITGGNNSRSGVSVISSHDIPSISSVNDLRYCVIGGYNAVTWSIDSKTGTYYGSVYNNSQPLPGFAEMYENLSGEIPHGRLLQLENGKVRLARNGETGFMISRPYESAAFVAGNPYHDWHKKYLVDQFGQTITETDSEGIVTKKLNPEYDPTKQYVPRSQRPDWTTCEKSGIVVVEYTGKVSVGDYLISGADGIAKRSSRKSNIRVLELVLSDSLTNESADKTDSLDSLTNESKTYAKVDLANQQLPDYVDEKVAITNAIATSLPTHISIKDIVFADDSISIASESRIKISVSLIGDILLSTDLSVALVGKSNSYDLLITYSKLKSSYVINAIYRGVVQPDTYQLVFSTSKILPAECQLYLKA